MEPNISGSQMQTRFNLSNKKTYSAKLRETYIFSSILLLAGCGGSSSKTANTSEINYQERTETFFSNISVNAVEKPNWVSALQMDEMGVVTELLAENENVYYYHFMTGVPSYELVNPIRNVKPATPMMREAAEEIFSELNNIFGVQFFLTDDPLQENVISIGTSVQPNTAGQGFFPTKDFFIGSDIFIGTDHNAPEKSNFGVTNYDYEVLVHEIGHSLGLKHTFMPDRENLAVLEREHDNSMWTAMSYNEVPSAFNGNFRAFDIMALSEYYGISEKFSPGNDVYVFDKNFGVVIADGGGSDLINFKGSSLTSFIDLRAGAESHLGAKSDLISDGNQLAIAYSTVIENVEAGNEADFIIGNDVANIINTYRGDDIIFPGEGADEVCAGPGNNIIDFTESNQKSDTIVFDLDSILDGYSEVYGFNTYANDLNLRDKIDFTELDLTGSDIQVANIFAQGMYDFSLSAEIQNNILGMSFEFNEGYICVTSDSASTGSAQDLYFIGNESSDFAIQKFCSFIGANMDIDFWQASSFVL